MLSIICWQDHKNCTFVQINIPREKNFSVFNGSLKLFPFTFEHRVKNFKTLYEKTSTRLSKLHSTFPKEEFPENRFFYGKFLVFKFLSVERNCFLLLAGVFSRVLKFHPTILRVQREKRRNFFSSMVFFANLLAV